MKTIKNLTIIGTSHISKDSIKLVKETIHKLKPDIIALELDALRFKRLISNKKEKIRLRELFYKGWLINLIGSWAEKELGKKVGTKPGDEIKQAIEIARKNKIKIALIDQDIRITLNKLSKRLTTKEKLRFLADLIKSPFQKKISIDLTKVPEKILIKKLTREVRLKYPNIYKTLIHERDYIMAKALHEVMKTKKKIIAVVGAGHEDNIINNIKKWNSQKKN